MFKSLRNSFRNRELIRLQELLANTQRYYDDNEYRLSSAEQEGINEFIATLDTQINRLRERE